MTTRNAKGTVLSIGEEDFPLYFGEWIKRRRQSLDLTQEQLAKRAFCSVHTIRKIEIGDRRPSKQLAELLSRSLEIPSDQLTTFLKAARGERSVESLRSITPDPVSQPAGQVVPIPGVLPRSLTPFIGREPEISAVGQLLQDPHCSLLTIVGQGGIGKTRLAIEAARQSIDLYSDGIWFVPLVSLNSPLQIVPAIAEAMNLKFSNPVNHQAQLLRHLCSKKVLLVMDNAEHLLEGVEVFAEILEGCPQLTLLVTSRERLNLLSEWVFEIQGLPLPPGDQVEQLEAYSSVTLFLQSARRVRAGFEMREADQKWVLRICRAMEGMPLGIELSAAWVGLLSCEEIAKEIEHNLDFLSVSMRDLPERHRSLRATLDHSWRLLNDEERSVLCSLSVFRGRFSLEAAQEVCGASLVHLSSLRNKCLLYRTEEELYYLHEIIRQYAGLKLAEHPGENERVKDQHALFYVQLLADWEKALQGPRQLETLSEMAQVFDNLSLGWQHMLTHCRPKPGQNNLFNADSLHSALFSISLFYEMRCRSLEAIDLFRESVESLKAVQSEFEGTENYLQLNSVLGHITAYLGLHHYFSFKREKGYEYLKEAVQLLEISRSRVEKAQAHVMLASFNYARGQLNDAVTLLKDCREVFREEGVKWWYALSTIHLAVFYIFLEKLQESEALFQEGFGLVEPGDLRSELDLRDGFAHLLYLQGDYERAEQMLRDNLQLSYLFGNIRFTASVLCNLGRVTLAMERVELAMDYIQKSIHLLNHLGETSNLVVNRLYLGKCFAARSEFEAARDQFWEVIQMGKTIEAFYLVYWGLVNIARTYLIEGKTDHALAISRLIERCSVEYKLAQDEGDALLADLQTALPEGQMETAMKQINGSASQDQARADVLAFVQEYESR